MVVDTHRKTSAIGNTEDADNKCSLHSVSQSSTGGIVDNVNQSSPSAAEMVAPNQHQPAAGSGALTSCTDGIGRLRCFLTCTQMCISCVVQGTSVYTHIYTEIFIRLATSKRRESMSL